MNLVLENVHIQEVQIFEIILQCHHNSVPFLSKILQQRSDDLSTSESSQNVSIYLFRKGMNRILDLIWFERSNEKWGIIRGLLPRKDECLTIGVPLYSKKSVST